VVNIPAGGGAEDGAEVVAYRAPLDDETAPRGAHRFAFLAFPQPKGAFEGDALDELTPSTRAKFRAYLWAHEAGLGPCCGAVYFNCGQGRNSGVACGEYYSEMR
jgi:hypothetical protein